MTDFELTTRSTSYLSDLRTQASHYRATNHKPSRQQHQEARNMTQTIKKLAPALVLATTLIAGLATTATASELNPSHTVSYEARKGTSKARTLEAANAGSKVQRLEAMNSAAGRQELTEARKATKSVTFTAQAVAGIRHYRARPGRVFLSEY